METPITQSVSELCLHLYRRSLHPELFNICSSRQFLQGNYEVLMWILPCSHAVTVCHGRDCMTEVICPPEQLLPKRCLVDRFKFGTEKSHRCNWGHNYNNYMVTFQVEKMSDNLFRQTHSDLTDMGKKRGLFVSFPQWARGELAPFSFIDYEARDKELHIFAYHAFCEQQTVIKTQSLFRLTKP